MEVAARLFDIEKRMTVVEEKADHPMISLATSTRITKPPLGIMPKNFHRAARIIAIRAALKRYREVGRVAPLSWEEELNALVSERDKEEAE